MKVVLHILALIVGSVLTVGLSEFVFIGWMMAVPFDITASPILRGSMWAQLLITGVGVIALTPIFRANARIYVGVYLGLTTLLYLSFMFMTFNPPVFAFSYVAPVVAGILLWSRLLRKRISS
jgi:hypothetical protein